MCKIYNHFPFPMSIPLSDSRCRGSTAIPSTSTCGAHRWRCLIAISCRWLWKPWARHRSPRWGRKLHHVGAEDMVICGTYMGNIWEIWWVKGSIHGKYGEIYGKYGNLYVRCMVNMMIYETYPLVNVYTKLWKITMFNGKTHSFNAHVNSYVTK